MANGVGSTYSICMTTVTGHPGTDEDEWLALPADPGNGGSTILSEKQLQLWALVLDSRKIPYRIDPAGIGWQLRVPAAIFHEAVCELRQYVEKNRNWPPPRPPAPLQYDNTLVTLSVLLLLATFYNITQLYIAPIGDRAFAWYAAGTADAASILAGQWWRTVTALTLHANWLHLFSNLTIGGFFIVFLSRELGSGLAWSLLLGSGVLGNVANAYMQQPDHSSVGASTAVFGAVGILAALSVVRYRNSLPKRWPLPVAAALALLGLLGTEGKNTDLGAHFFGFLFGICFGLVTEFVIARCGRPGPWLNAALALASAGTVVAAWWAAFVVGG